MTVTHLRRQGGAVDWTHPSRDRRRAVPRVPGAWLIDAGHLCLIAVLAGFGLALLNPALFATLGNFRAMAHLATAMHWAIALIGVSGLALWGWSSRRWVVRCAALFALGTAHWIIALGFLLSPPHGTGASTYPILALLAWCYAWDARNAR